MKLLQNTISYLNNYLCQTRIYKRLNNVNRELYSIYQNFNKYDVDANLPYLHRWCNSVSQRYRNTCNWEKKLDNANRDNCYR